MNIVSRTLTNWATDERFQNELHVGRWQIEREKSRLGSSVTINGDEFEVVEEFIYLDSLVTTDNDVPREIRRIISRGRACYAFRIKCEFWKSSNP